MSTTTTTTTTLDTLQTIARDHADRIPACATIATALEDPRAAGTMAAWMQARHGRALTTVQVNGMGAWAPTGRAVDARAARSYVLLAGSRRDYAGMRVLHSDDGVLIVTGDGETIAYVVES